MLSSFLVADVTYSRPMNMQRRRMVRAKFVRRKRKSKSHRLENQRIMNNSEENKELPDSLRKIIDAFQLVPEPAQRYKQLLFLAQKLEPFENVLKVDANKVPGCVSQVWVSVDAKEKKFYFSADSDSQLTKGLAALLVRGLSGNSAEDILSISPSFVSMLGLQQTLTPSRTNGFVNMLELMQAKTKEMQRRIEQN